MQLINSSLRGQHVGDSVRVAKIESNVGCVMFTPNTFEQIDLWPANNGLRKGLKEKRRRGASSVKCDW